MEEKMKFHITITDNETGETMADTDACAILANINGGSKVQQFHAVYCGAEEFAKTLNSLEDIVMDVQSRHPEIGALSKLLGITNKTEQTETEETENEE